MKRDSAKAVELTRKIEEQSQELERQKNCIDEHNKQIYELKKNKDQFQATRKYVYVIYLILCLSKYAKIP